MGLSSGSTLCLGLRLHVNKSRIWLGFRGKLLTTNVHKDLRAWRFRFGWGFGIGLGYEFEFGLGFRARFNTGPRGWYLGSVCVMVHS